MTPDGRFTTHYGPSSLGSRRWTVRLRGPPRRGVPSHSRSGPYYRSASARKVGNDPLMTCRCGKLGRPLNTGQVRTLVGEPSSFKAQQQFSGP
jgi:hypothetical protein